MIHYIEMEINMNEDFVTTLKNLVEEAKANTDKLRGSEAGRNWAIVRTDLEKTLAYVESYLVKDGE